jgi:hypothetical protein
VDKEERTSWDGKGLSFTVTGPGGSYEAYRSLSKTSDGKLVMHNNTFFMKPGAAGKGLGTKVFTDQVDATRELGVDRIETLAGRGKYNGQKMNGYYTWPRFGYDGPIPTGRGYRNPPPHLASAKTVGELMALPGGKEWWKENGRSVGLTFDLKDGSHSMKTLNAYKEEKRKMAAEKVPTGNVRNAKWDEADEANAPPGQYDEPDVSEEDEEALDRV